MFDSLKTRIEAAHEAEAEKARLFDAALPTERGSAEWQAYRAFDKVSEARDDLKRALREAIGLD